MKNTAGIRKLLIVDDDYMTVEPIIEFLKIENNIVDFCETIEDAFERLETSAYDFIFLDVMMAVGDILDPTETVDGHYSGLKVLEMIRESPQFEHHKAIPVILITNWREEARVEEAAQKYSAKILRKPLSITSVKGVL